VQFISATGEKPNLDLPAFELSFANTANPLIVERVPFPESISCAQERQSIVKFNIGCHNKKQSALCIETNNREAG